MSARMPIAAALYNGVIIGSLGDVFAALAKKETHTNHEIVLGPIDHGVKHDLLRLLGTSVKFDIQLASDLYWGNRREHYTMDDFAGGLRLPYPQMWCEYRIPAEGYLGGKKYHDDGPPSHFACVLYEDIPQLPGGHVSIWCLVLGYISGAAHVDPHLQRPVLYNECAIRFDVDEAGSYVDNSLVEYHPKNQDAATCDTLMREAKSAMFVACMALTLVNCKNVSTAKAGHVHFRRSGTDKRRGVQPVAYHTIVLPGMTVERGKVSKRQAAANAEALRLHRVRGHFKTFTKEAPLLGKHTGTYWWNPGVRGNAKRGVVVQDYKIGEPA